VQDNPLTGQWFVVAGDVPKGVKSLRAGFNLPFITVLLKVIDWSDKGLCVSLILGFQLYGDLRVDDNCIFHQKSEQEMTDERTAFVKDASELDDHTTNL